jgi:hypothetical protein
MLLFHGTRNISAIFDAGFALSRGGEFGPGIYFTNNPNTASFYALRVARGPETPSVISADIRMTHPFVVPKIEWLRMTERSSPKTVQRRLIRKGHDGIIGIALNGYEKQYVVFSPSQIDHDSLQIVERS